MKYVLTLIANCVDDFPVEIAARAVDSLIQIGAQAERPHWLGPAACDLLFDNIPPHLAEVTIRAALAPYPIDMLVQEIAHRRKNLLVADMESTMIAEEMLDELADLKGIRQKIADITLRAMNGELDFKDALKERVQLLAGIPISSLHDAWERVHITPGGKMLVATMRANGARTVLVSGGFTIFTAKLKDKLKFDAHHGNELEIRQGILTGNLVPPIRDKSDKLIILRQEADTMGLSPIDTLAVGDGANDIPMLEDAGLGIAYHAKPAVKAVCSARLDHTDLSALLYAQGYKREDFVNPYF